MKTTRKLNFSDTFRLARIIKAANVTMQDISKLLTAEKLPEGAKPEEIEAAQTAKGMEMISYIIDRAPGAEKQLYEFLAVMAGEKPENIAKADVTEVFELISDIITTNKDIKDFFIAGMRSATVLPST